MRGSADDGYRVVIDEEGLDWHGRPDTELSRLVDKFADLLESLADGRQVALMTPAFSMECWESVMLVEISYTTDRRVSRDARVRLARLLDKCRAIEPEDDDIPQLISLHGALCEPSWGMSHALTRAAAGRAMSCLTGPRTTLPAGWTTVTRHTDPAELAIHLMSDPGQITDFWRGIFSREPVPENDFFALAGPAFPRLIFSGDLTFHHFRGSYDEVLPWLIRLLGALDDHFAAAMARHRGDQKKVMAEFSAYGLDVSPENSQTRKDAKAWAARLITHGGEEYRCEWHGKRLWDRDRVHFSLPIAKYEDRVLIGIFTEHLP